MKHPQKVDELVFLEYPAEVEAFLKSWGAGKSEGWQSSIIALSPAAGAKLKQNGWDADNTIPYLTPISRSRAWQKSAELTFWMRDHFDFKDGLGVSAGYAENLIWYTRWLTNYLIWSIEILNNAIADHVPKSLTVFRPQPSNVSGPYAGISELYFGVMAERVALQQAIPFQRPRLRTPRLSWGRMRASSQRLVANLVPNPMVRGLHRRRLAGLAEKNPVLFTSQFYRLDVLAGRLQDTQGIFPVLLTDWGVNKSWGWPLHEKPMPPFGAEAKTSLLESPVEEDRDSRQRLEDCLNKFFQDIGRETKLFSHHGISFADIVANKVQAGIKPVIMGLHRRSAAHQKLLNLLKPSLVVANGCRIDDIIIGELCLNNKIPSLMITHGSHVPPSSEVEQFEWGEHAKRLINAPYQRTALQSPLAEEFRKVFSNSAEGVRTGPLIWAKSEGRKPNLSLRSSLVGHSQKCKVVVHAGTPKGRTGLRFHVTETPDEYVQSISNLVEAVNVIPDTHLIVMFRPSEEISSGDLIELLPHSTKTTITTNAPLVEVLGFADLLVSFSSTVIEEALLNKVPVLLYGGGGRYKHIDAPGIVGQRLPDMGQYAAYHVSNRADLASALEKLMAPCGNKQSNEAKFDRYCFQPGQPISISQLVKSVQAFPERS